LDLLSSLNPAQQDAVRQTDGPLLILAGAGSGKTRVIAHRIAYLVSEKIAYPDQIMAVTFTNKAAQEMRERVERLLDMDCRSMWVSTFHALCARLLRREAHNIGLSRDFTIYDSADQQSVIKQLLKDYHLDAESYQPGITYTAPPSVTPASEPMAPTSRSALPSSSTSPPLASPLPRNSPVTP
jgi:DNA helicase-2/ATP-dependent DNA helicase PcrA